MSTCPDCGTEDPRWNGAVHCVYCTELSWLRHGMHYPLELVLWLAGTEQPHNAATDQTTRNSDDNGNPSSTPDKHTATPSDASNDHDSSSQARPGISDTQQIAVRGQDLNTNTAT